MQTWLIWIIVTGGMELELPIKAPIVQPDYYRNTTSRRVLSIYIRKVLPQVKRLLRKWEAEARNIPEPTLQYQALASLEKKAFHCQGGAVYAVPWGNSQKGLLRFIVAYQTLCDYLDNLCDRVGNTDGQAFQQLHLSLLDALNTENPSRDYYRYYPLTDDGGYVDKLVRTCQESLKDIPNYDQIEDSLILLARLYSDLQVKKHLAVEIRHEELSTWAAKHSSDFDGLLWPEYAAACGSTLGIFALLKSVVGQRERLDNDSIEKMTKAYFPWICGLHILLDYFIDGAEDRLGGDLNFTFYYESEQVALERLKLFVDRAASQASELPEPAFHATVVNGLLAMYLSDRKIKEQRYQKMAAVLIDTGGQPAWRTYHVCRIVRRFL